MRDERSKTKYDTVRQQFAEREDAKRKYIDENTQFVAMVANGFREYLGMPTQYEHTKDGTTTFRSYVPLYSLEDEDTFTEEAIWTDTIGHYSDGDFNFGLGIVLEPKPNTYPKQVVQVKVECTRKSGSVEVKIAGESVTCAFDGTESPDISKVHDLLYALLNKWLASRWGDPESKRAIGFKIDNKR